uniref:Transposase n=1 Tax=Candidatus Kentrum sp. LFY TaxID=2126342 RepID=A0A450VCE4_9GAMM|nr:MAG: Transposase [Candidatus Kentron sp. LFY]
MPLAICLSQNLPTSSFEEAGILNAVVLKVTNGPAEGINSRIKMIKVRSRGFRNKYRFVTAIYFHLGGLNLYP